MVRSPKIKVLTRLHSFWRLCEEMHVFVFSSFSRTPAFLHLVCPSSIFKTSRLTYLQVKSLSLSLLLPLNLCLSYFFIPSSYHHHIFFTLLLSLIPLPPLKMTL